MHQFPSDSEAQTIALGDAISRLLPPSGLVLISGDLGAGKTTLVKGIAQARAGIDPAEVTSPTFTLIHEYGDPPRVYHADLYRIGLAQQVRALGLDELIESGALVLVEWGERFPELWPAHHSIRIADCGGDQRLITIDSNAA